MRIEELNEGCYRLTATHSEEAEILGKLNYYISQITKEKEREANIRITGRRKRAGSLDVDHLDIQLE